MAWFGRSVPRVYDAILSKLGVKAQLTGEPPRNGDTFDRGGANLRERSGRDGRRRERSSYPGAYTLAAGPRTALIGIAGVMLVAAAGR